MGKSTLHMGTRNESVSELKSILKTLEYSVSNSNDEFDMRTRSAVEAFQNDNGLMIDGVVDERTWTALERAFAGKNGGISATYAPQTASQSIEQFLQQPVELFTEQEQLVAQAAEQTVEAMQARPTIRQGSTGEAVRELQTSLRTLGFLTGGIDGIFGSITAAAVRAFQRARGLTADGIVGVGTWRELDLALAELSSTASRPTLRKGSSGASVKELQVKLTLLGFYYGDIDGDFGNVTDTAVRNFQQAWGLTVDGVVGPSTWKVIDNAFSASPELPPAPGARPNLREGSSGAYVVELQTMLKNLGYFSGTIDGQFGPQTAEAVRSFQRSNSLVPDAIVGPATWTALDNAIALPPPTGRPVLREGSSGDYVVQLQNRLKELGYFTGTVDGKFGPKTAEAVKNFQRANGLVADGVVGNATWNALDNATIPAPPTGRPVLREGSSGDYVVQLQTKLRQLGYYQGSLDGKFGPATTVAVKNFQRANGLVADGIVGESTWAALDRATVPPTGGRPILKEGSTGEYVIILQEKLKELGYFWGSVTGSFGPETTTAVKAFQRANGLEADGVVGPNTWEILYALTSTPPPPEELPEGPRPTLQYGDSGPFVSQLQTELKLLMFYNGAISGNFDWETTVAVKAFQDVNRLTPDGIVGRSTWFALYSLYPPPVVC